MNSTATPLDVAFELAGNPQVPAYFALLFYSLNGCIRRCTSTLALVFAVSTLVVTWGYILIYTVEYKRAGKDNLFDDAYVDVLEGDHFGTSAQLLTWVIVAVVWTHNSSPDYMTFGALGAMSAAFFMWIPQVTIASQRAARMVPVCFAATSAVAM